MKKNKKFISAISVAALGCTIAPIAAMTSCGPDKQLKEMRIDAYANEYEAGKSYRFTDAFGVFDAESGQAIGQDKLTYECDNEYVEIDDSGEGFTCIKEGTGIITIKAEGYKNGRVEVQIAPEHVVTLESIEVTTAPTKTTYTAGEKLNLTGLKVMGHFSDSTKDRELTEDEYTTDPDTETGLSTSMTSVTVKAVADTTKTTSFNITVNPKVATLDRIDITTAPTKTTYTAGEKLNLTGLKVMGHFSDSTKDRELTEEEYTTDPDTETGLSTSMTSVTVKAVADTTKTASFNITVNPKVATLDRIDITTEPTKKIYNEGEKLALAGMEVTGYFSDGSNRPLDESEYTTDPDTETGLSTSMTSVTVKAVADTTKTDTFNIAVEKTEFRFELDEGGQTYTLAECNNKDIVQAAIPASYNDKPVAGIGEEAFSGCTSLTSIEFPSSVTAIGKYAFEECTSLASVEIPDSVTSIGAYTFRDCTSLTSVVIPNSVTAIGKYAFEDCTELSTIDVSQCTFDTIPEGWSTYASFGKISNKGTIFINNADRTGMWEEYFSTASDEAIKFDNEHWEIKVTEFVFTLDEGGQTYTLAKCKNKNIVQAVIPASYNDKPVVGIGSSAFDGCTSLASVDISNSVTSIGAYTFRDCTSLTSVVIPNSVTTIDDYAFNECTELSTIDVSQCTFTTILDGWSTLMSFKSLPDKGTIFINNSEQINMWKQYFETASSGSIQFDNEHWEIKLQDFEFTLDEDGQTYTLAKCNNKDIAQAVIPVSYNDKPVVGIGEDVFNECTSLTSVEIPDSVTSIGEYAFKSCKSLTSVVIPDSVTSIGSDAFNGCINLTSIEIPNSVTTICENTFNGCASLASIEIPNKVTTIGDGAFTGCTSLASIIIPSSVTSIGKNAFIGCASLASVVISNSVTTIGDGAFSECQKLSTIDVSQCTFTTIPVGWSNEFSFYQKPGKGTIFINNAEQEDMWKEYFQAASHRTIIFEEDYWEIKVQDFEFTLDEGGKSYTLSKCKNKDIVQAVIPASYNGKPVVGIGKEVFREFASLTSVVIPSSVTSIGEKSFWHCTSLASVIIPNSVKSIGADVFLGCSKLSTIDVSQCTFTTIPWGWSTGPVFYQISNNGTISINNSEQIDMWEKYFKDVSVGHIIFDKDHWKVEVKK